MHYHLHHHVPKTKFGKRLRTHHMRHHFQDHRYGFGVSSPLWDAIMGTLPRSRARPTARHGFAIRSRPRAPAQHKSRRLSRRSEVLRAGVRYATLDGGSRPSSTAITLSATALAIPSRDGIVAEPMCGSSTARGAASSRGETSGSFS